MPKSLKNINFEGSAVSFWLRECHCVVLEILESIRLHTRKTIYLNLSPLHSSFSFYGLARYILSCQLIFFSLKNDDMESSKRSVKLLSLFFH